MKGPIARTTLQTTIILGFRLVLQAGTLVVLARVLGVVDFGSYVTLSALAVILGTLGSFGTHLILLRDVARKPSAREHSLRLALGTTILCGSMLLTVYVALATLWLQLPDVKPSAIVYLGTAELLLQPLLVIAATERHARDETVQSQILLNLPLSMRLGAALLVGWLASGNYFTLFAIGHLLAVALAVLLALALAPERWPPPWRWRTPSAGEWRDGSGYALINISASGVAELDKLLAGKLLTASSAGVYVAASRTVGALALPVMAMMVSAMPRLFREPGTQGRQLRTWLFACSGIYGLAAGVGIWLLAPLFPMLFGSDYARTDELVRWLAWAVPAISLRAAATNVLTTIDKPWIRVGSELTGWLVLSLLAWRLAPAIGERGLALSLILSEWLLACGTWVAVWGTASYRPSPIANGERK